MHAIDTCHLYSLEPSEVLVPMATHCVKKTAGAATQNTRGRQRRGRDRSTFLGNKAREADPPVEAITETYGEERGDKANLGGVETQG